MTEIHLNGRLEIPALRATMNANAVSTTNYNELGNKPKINGNLLYGDKTSAQLGIILTAVSDGNGNITLSV